MSPSTVAALFVLSLALSLPLVLAGGGDSDGHVSLVFDGVTRHARIHIPPRLSSPAPLVINFHALGANPELQALLSGMNAIADREGFIVLYPQGQYGATFWDKWPIPTPGPSYSFNAGGCCPEANTKKADDIAWTRRLLEWASANITTGVDPKRVYVTGMSNGGFMTNRMGCEASDIIAAIAPVSGPMMNYASPILGGSAYACNLAANRTVPTLHIHGLADPIVPFKGSSILGFPSIPDSVAGWRKRNRCLQVAPVQSFNNGSVACDSWCDGAQNVTLCSVKGAGHSWPGAPSPFCAGVYPFQCSPDMDASEQIWSFFQRYSL